MTTATRPPKGKPAAGRSPAKRRRRAAAWKRYAHGSRVDHFAWWCKEHCVQTTDQFRGRPLVLEGWQLDYMGEALAVTADGFPFWRTCALVLPRKNGKTTLISAYSVYHVDVDPGKPLVQFAASSDDQADELFGHASDFIKGSELAGHFHIRDYVGEISRVDGDGTINRMPAQWRRAHGPNPSRVVVDELHTWTTQNLRKMWAGLTTGDMARLDFQVFVISTAGEEHERETGLLGNLIDSSEDSDGPSEVEHPHQGLTISRNFEAGVLLYHYSAPTEGLRDPLDLRRKAHLKRVKAANPASWVREESLRRKQADTTLPDADYLQLHCNVWHAGRETYVSPSSWKALAIEEQATPLGFIEPGRMVAIGADGSRVHDCTVVAWASPAPDDHIDVDARVFGVRPQAPHHELHERSRIDYERVEEFILELFGDYHVAEAVYDPRYLERSADIITARLDEDMIAAVEPSSRLYRDALSAFERGVVDGRIRHRGDRVLAAHIAACKGTLDEKGWILKKRDHSKHIDAVIAMAMAYWRAERLADAGEAGVDFGDDLDDKELDDEYSDIWDDDDGDES